MRIRLPTQEEARFNRRVMLVAVIIIGLWWYTRPPPPPLDTIDGTYVSICCGQIRLRHGLLILGANQVSFTLANMKFGIVAYTEKTISVTAGNQVAAAFSADGDHPSILFNDDHAGFTLVGPGIRENHFRRSGVKNEVSPQ